MRLGRFVRASARDLCHAVVITLGLAGALATAGELIRPTLDASDLRVVVSYVSTGDLVGLQARHGGKVDWRELRQDYRHGFSILKTNLETGARTCEIYLPVARKPRDVDDEGTLTLGHELLHCMLGDYHR